MKKKNFPGIDILPQKSPSEGRERRDASRLSQNLPVDGRQLELFTPQGIRHKRQISSIPGISPKERHRYQVTLGGEILGDRLTLDEALKLLKAGSS
jgi:hypothetical protein